MEGYQFQFLIKFRNFFALLVFNFNAWFSCLGCSNFWFRNLFFYLKFAMITWALGHSLRHTNHISAVKEWLTRDMTCINNFLFNNFFLTIHTSSKFDFKNISKLAWNNLKSAMFVFIFDNINKQKNISKNWTLPITSLSPEKPVSS